MSKPNNGNKEDTTITFELQQEIKSLTFQLESRMKDNEENREIILALKNTLLLMEKEKLESINSRINDYKKESIVESLAENCRKLEKDIANLHEAFQLKEKSFAEEKASLIKHYEDTIKGLKFTIDANNIKLDSVANLEKINIAQADNIKDLEKKCYEIEKEYNFKLDQRKIKEGFKFSDLRKNMMDSIENTQRNVEQLNIHHMDTSTKLIIMQNTQLMVEIEFQTKQLEENFKIRVKLEKQIEELNKTIEVHESVSNVLAEKNRKYIVTIKNLNEKIKNLTEKFDSPFEKFEGNSNDISLFNYQNESIYDQNSSSNRQSRSINNSILHNKDKSKNKHNHSISLSKSKEIYQNLKDFQITINLEKKIQNLINSLQRKQKDYDILKLNYENLHEKISIYEHKNQVFLKVFQEGFNRITEKKDSISKSTEKSMIDPDKLRTSKYDELTNDEKYLILTTLINGITPFLNFTNVVQQFNDNILSNNLKLTNHFNKKHKEIDEIEKKMKLTKKNRSTLGFPEAKGLRIELPKINNTDNRFLISNKVTVINNPIF